MFKKESKESKVLFLEQYPLDNVCATKQGTKIDCPCPLGPKEIDGLLVPKGKAKTLLTDHLIIGLPLRSVPA